MITDIEIINGMLKCVNRILDTDYRLHHHFGYYTLQEENKKQLLSSASTERTEEQMIEYLAGVEDGLKSKEQRE